MRERIADTAEAIARDVLAIGRIDCVPALLRIVCETTGMGFAAVARVTEGSWVACAVHDDLQFGLRPGGELDVNTTLCKEARQARSPIVIDHASADDRYCTHHTPRIYHIESYVSVPIVFRGGEYFGNLCAIDPHPRRVSDAKTVAMFERFAELIAMQLENDRLRELERNVMLNEREAGELREQFIAVLGHDLRNPLSAISACSQLLERTADSQVVATARRISANARRMSGLIDDTLDFARGRLGGGLGTEIVEVANIGAALEAVVGELEDSHPNQSIDCRIDTPHAVWCDVDRIQQLVSNLLANALTHGAAGRPVAFTARTGNDSFVLEIFNEGVPIDPAHLAKVFQPFWRGSASGAGEGLGLGLYICSQIVAAHHGELTVTSSAEQGTRFVARLPIAGGA
jgi:signal transduction histidine kinase